MTDQPRGKRYPDDDVEGHSIRGRGFSDEPEEDGRGPQFSSGALGGDDDVEGHGLRGKGFSDEAGQGEDVEGHRFRGGVTDEQAHDDVEGHAARIKM